MSEAEFREYHSGEGAKEYDSCLEESVTDHIFGVPIFVFKGEPFWGNDRIPLLEMQLKERGLAR
jgi:2-hydroxychromene-2-carboxylate isomerase